MNALKLYEMKPIDFNELSKSLTFDDAIDIKAVKSKVLYFFDNKDTVFNGDYSALLANIEEMYLMYNNPAKSSYSRNLSKSISTHKKDELSNTNDYYGILLNPNYIYCFKKVFINFYYTALIYSNHQGYSAGNL
jgi:hypothetical protein